MRRFSTAVLIGLLVAVPAVAQQKQFSRPNRDQGPTRVELAVAVIEIRDINDADESFDIDFVIEAKWRDERLAWEPEDQSEASSLFYALDEAWHPRMQIINEKDLDARLQSVIAVAPDGAASWTQRFQGLLSTPLELRAFPTDRQRLPIRMVSASLNEEEILLVVDSGSMMMVEDTSLSGWSLGIVEPESSYLEIENADVQMPQVTFFIEAQRDAWYFVWTMMIPLTLIVFMAWMVFWIDPGLLPPQVGMSTAAMFSMIAYRTALRVSLPKVSYLTKAEIFILGCTLLVFAALAHAIATARFAKTGREEFARKLDRVGRWVYVASYFVVLVAAIYW